MYQFISEPSILLPYHLRRYTYTSLHPCLPEEKIEKETNRLKKTAKTKKKNIKQNNNSNINTPTTKHFFFKARFAFQKQNVALPPAEAAEAAAAQQDATPKEIGRAAKGAAQVGEIKGVVCCVF